MIALLLAAALAATPGASGAAPAAPPAAKPAAPSAASKAASKAAKPAARQATRPAAPAPAPAPTSVSELKAGDWLVEARTLNYRFKQRQTELTGEPVKMSRTDAVLTCKRVLLQNDEGDQFQTAICLGDVKFVRSTSVVTCQKATWDEVRSRLTCEGSPELRDGERVAKGSLLIYDLAQDEAMLQDPVITLPGNSEDARKALDARRGGGGK